MKRTIQIILSTTTASLLTLTGLAQDNGAPKSDPQSDPAREHASAPRGIRLNGAAKASDILGITVNNYQDEKLGTVEELAVDLESGRIVQVILSTGGFIGVGNRLSAVPPGALHHDATKKVLHLDATREKLKGATEFKSAEWTDNSDSEHLSAVYTYYGQDSALHFVHKGDPADASANPTTTRNVDGANNLNRARNLDGARNVDGARDRDAVTGENRWMIPASRLSQTQKASKLMGLLVKNQQGEKLGKVDNLLVDVQSGRIVAVVVSSGGFLGLGDELSAVPPTALSFSPERDTLLLDTSRETLTAAPHFKSDKWPDFNEPAYSESVYRAYKVDPYFTTNAMTDADNTALNARDRQDRTLTPFDQGNSKADTEMTAQIRKAILGTKEMSVNAQNVKIITNGGRVTLRGPVKNAEEKRAIGEIANGFARSENVDNQLEVTLKTSSN